MKKWFDFLRPSAPAPAPRDRIEPRIGNVADGEVVISSDRLGMGEIFGSYGPPAAAVVNDKTAMRVSAVSACVTLISGGVSQLPLKTYERISESVRQEIEHDYWWMLNERPCAAWTAATSWEFMVSQVLLRGDCVWYLVRNRAGAVTSMIPYPRSRVIIEPVYFGDPRQPQRLNYYFTGPNGYFGAEQEDVLHFPGFGFNGVHSMSVIQWGARNGIGIAIRGDEYAASAFTNGGRPNVTIKTAKKLSPDQKKEFREAWVETYGNNVGLSGIPLILTEGLEAEELEGISAQDAQMLQSRQWQTIDIARAFGVPPFMIGETTKASSFGTGIGQMGIGFVTYTLGAHLKRFKDELNSKLFSTSRYFIDYDTSNLTAGDLQTMAEYFGRALGGPGARGWMTRNEVRRQRNLPPVAGGDEFPPDQPASGNPAAPPPKKDDQGKDNEDPETPPADQ